MNVNEIYLGGLEYRETTAPKRYTVNTSIAIPETDWTVRDDMLKIDRASYSATLIPAGSEVDILETLSDSKGTVWGAQIKYYHSQYHNWWNRNTNSTGYKTIIANSTYIGPVTEAGGGVNSPAIYLLPCESEVAA